MIGQAADILLVTDEPGVRRATAAALSHCGYKVIEEANIDEAVAALARTPEIALLIIDAPPDMDRADIMAIAARWPRLEVRLLNGYRSETA